MTPRPTLPVSAMTTASEPFGKTSSWAATGNMPAIQGCSPARERIQAVALSPRAISRDTRHRTEGRMPQPPHSIG